MLPFGRILCPIDFSEPSYEALKAANEVALHFSAELQVVHVVAPIPVVVDYAYERRFDWPAYQKELEASARAKLNQTVAERVSSKLKVLPAVVSGNAADQIIRAAERDKADLVVIATHGLTGLRHLVFGSVAERVVRHAPCPVLTIRAPHDEP